MGIEKPLSLCVITQNTIRNLGSDGINDVFEYRGPDIVLVESERDRDRVSKVSDANIFTLNKLRRGDDILTTSVTDSVVDLVITTSAEQLGHLDSMESDGCVNTDTATFILNNILDVDIDLINLETTLIGKDKYQKYLDATGDEIYTHLTTRASPEYQSVWEDGFTVQGVNPAVDTTDHDSTPEVAFFKLFSDGVVDSQTIPADQFGLQALDQVGPKRLRKLNEGGVIAIEDVIECGIRSLSEISGIGDKTAEKIYYSARAQVEQTPIRLTDASLPNTPLYIDIETDGLTPTMVWLIGVYDPLKDRYIPFIETDPEKKGVAVTHFMDWYSANATDRTLVAYNGMNFDFPVIADHINKHCPKYMSEWDKARTLDLLWWATKQDNAILPGQTNKLEDVAHALGWEDPDIEVTGEAVGKRFTKWMTNPCDENELDWEKYKKYCESDVRALHHILEAIRSAEVAQGKEPVVEQTPAEGTTQGTLGDY